ncbi:MAG: hypothetical protein AB1414_11665 [bacterium]
MEALIIDVENELKFIYREIEILKRKKTRLDSEKDSENIDSHIKAIALTLHSIYSGYEKILEIVIKGIDGDLPSAKEYHSALLKRAYCEIPTVRPPIILEETWELLNALRLYRHKLRRIYTYLVSPVKIINLTNQAFRCKELFEKDWSKFKEYLLSEGNG